MAQEQKRNMPGGMGSPKSASENPEVQQYLDQVREAAESAAGRSFSSFDAVDFATQLVNGTNYFIKVNTGEGKYIHVRLHKPFKGEVSFHSLKDGKTESDVLIYF